MGAITVALPALEVNDALQKNAIDAYLGKNTVVTFRLAEATKEFPAKADLRLNLIVILATLSQNLPASCLIAFVGCSIAHPQPKSKLMSALSQYNLQML